MNFYNLKLYLMHLKDINFIHFIEDDNIKIIFGNHKRFNSKLKSRQIMADSRRPILLI